MKKIARFIPALIWMAVIFYFSSQQTTGVTGIKGLGISIYWQRFFILKFFHLIEYAVLSFLLLFGSNRPLPAFAAGYGYALIDEYHQSFVPGRTSKLIDTFIDILGLIIGWAIYRLVVSNADLLRRLISPLLKK